MATTTHSHDHDDLLGNDLPPPAYELTNTEFERKITDATQRSLQEQPQRPALPPLDEDGFPIWSEELFKYNEAQRQREDETRSAKLRSEYTYPVTQASGSSASASSPPSRPPVSDGLNKKENKWWFDSSPQVIAQDEDDRPLNIRRPPSMSQTQNLGSRPPPIQVQVGPRPHDLLAQPQSPTSDVDEDDALMMGDSSLGRAPTYYPMGQTHPGHVQRLERHSTRGSESSIRTTLPAFTSEAESLEGPAYEEVVQASRSTHQERRVTGEWRPLDARPQVQERVSRASMVPYASASPPPRVSPAPASVPPSVPAYAPPPPPPVPVSAPPPPRPTPTTTYTPPVRPATTSYTPSGYNPPVTAPRPSGFDPYQAYRSSQTHGYNPAAQVGAGEGILEAQRALIEGGAGAFYNTAVAATMQKNPAFLAPAPPPPRVVEDDGASVFSGRSSGRQSVGSGARMSVYAPHDPTPNRMSYVPPMPAAGPGYQPMGGQAYQPAPAPAPGTFMPPPPPGTYHPANTHAPSSRPLPNSPGFGQPNVHMGGHMHPPSNGFVAPPPPPGVGVQPGKKPGKLYKRL